MSGIATSSSVDTWYVTLQKPGFTPPGWLFAPVWTALYVLMGVAAGLVNADAAAGTAKKPALQLFALQLGLNGLWSVLFFGLRNPTLALAEIIVLWLAIAFTLVRFYRIQSTAAYLLLPYLLWVSFAGLLNGAIALLN